MILKYLLLLICIRCHFVNVCCVEYKSSSFHETIKRSLLRLNQFDQENCGKSSLISYENHFDCSGGPPKPPDGQPVKPEEIAPGNLVKEKEVPSFVTIKCKVFDPKDIEKSNDTHCEGVIIGKDLIMTSTKCVMNKNACKVNMGYSGGQYRQADYVKGYCKFPQMIKPNKKGLQIDVSILQLRNEIEFNEYVQTACFDLNRSHLDDAICFSVEQKDGPHYYQFKRGCNTDTPKVVPMDQTCYSAIKKPLCNKRAYGAPLYCWDSCSGTGKQFVLGIFSTIQTKKNVPCSDNRKSWFFFSDLKKIKDFTRGMLDDIINNCHELT